ncbi:MAG: hypothetical protein V3W41_17560 [Planctomycetota bacterium]
MDAESGHCSGAKTSAPPNPPVAAKLSEWMMACFVAAACVLPFVFRRQMSFKSDDAWLIGQGYEKPLLQGFVDAFAKPFLDTVLVDFYRPLYSYLYLVEAKIFGAEAQGYYFANILWHFLAIALGFLVMRRVLPRSGAVLGSLWFGLSPWCVNNVAWLVGACTSLCTVFIFASVLAYFRYQDSLRRRGDRGPESLKTWPWWALVWATLGVFFRETALFVPALIAMFDIYERRWSPKTLANWLFLAMPFGIYLVCRQAVLGTLGGGYAKLVELWGPTPKAPGMTDQALEISKSALRLLIPGSGTFTEDWGVLRIAGLILVVAIVLFGLFGRRRTGGLCWLFGIFVVIHAAPLLYVDHVIQGGSSQRWHTVLWGIGAGLAVCVYRSRWPLPLGIALLMLIAFNAHKTWTWLGNYEASAAMTEEIRAQIDAAPTELVFVYNIIPYDQQSPNFEAGLGQLAREPFSSARKRVYPLMYEQRYLEGDRQAQTPIAARLLAEGKPVTALWCDWEERRVDVIPEAFLNAALSNLAAMKRLDVSHPAQPGLVELQPEQDLSLELDTRGLARLDIHLITPVAEMLFSRFPQTQYANGGFEDKGTRYRENLAPMLRAANFMAEQVDNRAWIWVVGYDRTDRSTGPIAVSDFIEFKILAD